MDSSSQKKTQEAKRKMKPRCVMAILNTVTPYTSRKLVCSKMSLRARAINSIASALTKNGDALDFTFMDISTNRWICHSRNQITFR